MELTDAIAEGLLRTVMKNARLLHQDPDNYEARAGIMWAKSLAHNGLTGYGNDGEATRKLPFWAFGKWSRFTAPSGYRSIFRS